MVALIESFNQRMTPEMLSSIGRAIGMDEAMARRSLELVGLVIQDALTRKSQTTAGLDEIVSMLASLEGDGSQNTLGVIGEDGVVASAASADMLALTFGSAISAISRMLSDELGFDVMPLLGIAVPIVLGLIAEAARSQRLDAKGIAHLLQTERQRLMSQVGPEVLAVLEEIEDAIHKANAIQQVFTADQWRLICLAPLAVTFYVMSASPSGVIGSMKEIAAASDAMRDVLRGADATSLVNIAFGSAMQKLSSMPEIDEDAPRESMIRIIQMAAETVKAKMPDEAQRFTDALGVLAQKVAEAAKEGGFLGVGAKTISHDEQRALDEIRAALA